jgi:hypothetical protein
MERIRIKHPDWLEYSKPGQSIDLFRRGLLPEKIAGWMIVVSLKHPLRAVYGSDLLAALALLWLAVSAPFRERWLSWKYRKEGKEQEAEWAAEDSVEAHRAAASKN